MSQSGRYISNTGPGGYIQTLTGNSGGAVPPTAGNINTIGGNNITVVGNPATSTLTASVTGTTTHAVQIGNATGSLTSIAVGTTGQVLIGATGADPAFAALGTNSGLTAHSLLLGQNNAAITALGVAANGQIPIGSTGADPVLAVPTNGNNISWATGAGSLTANLTGTTAHSIQIGNAGGSLTSLGVATNGQLPIGSTGADPVLATLTAGTGITITNGAGTITIGATGTITFTYTNVNTTPYVVAANDEFLSVDCSGGVITVQLPNTPTTGRAYIIKDRTGNAATNNITVTTVGGVVTIDGGTTYVMNTNREAINVLFNGTNYEVY